MKNSVKIAIASFVLFSSANSFAASESQLLGQCKSFVKNQITDVTSIKSASIKTRKNKFEAKFRVRTADDRGVYLCTIERDAAPVLARVDKGAQQIAAKR